MYAQWWTTLKRIFGAALMTGYLAVIAAHAQVQVGDNLNMSLNGSMGVGYGGSYSSNPEAPNADPSAHGVFLQGQGNLNGYYYNPNFLSFSAQPYYNRTQANSSSASILNSTGIGASVNLFSGSHFPGSVSYSKFFNDGSQYGLGIPGTPGLSSSGTSQNFDVTWGVLFPKWPTLSATWGNSSNSDTILGENGTTSTHIGLVNLISTYNLKGFLLTGNFIHQKVNSVFPEFVAGSNGDNDSRNNAYALDVNHSLPWSGSFTADYYRSNYNSDSNAFINNGAASTVSSTVAVAPTDKLSLNFGVRYYDNLTGAFQQSFLSPGSLPITPFSTNSNGLLLNGFGAYNLGHGFILVGYASHGVQHFEGGEFSSNQFGGTVTYSYSRPFLGLLYFSFGLVNTANNSNDGNINAVGNVSLRKKIDRWEINANANYAQGLQNSVSWFTTSNYSYGGSIRTHIGSTGYWSASAQDGRTGITQLAGYSTHAETYITTLTWPRYGASANYSKSNGTSILTTSGSLVPIPFGQAPPLIPGEIVYGGSSYGATFNVIPVRRMLVTASWFRLNSNTASNTPNQDPLIPPTLIYSSNYSNRVYMTLNYQFRKMDLQANYWRVNQEISASGLSRVTNNNYSFTISRWFNVF